jgi:hypothetical protein
VYNPKFGCDQVAMVTVEYRNADIYAYHPVFSITLKITGLTENV